MPHAIPVPAKFGEVQIGDFVTANRFDRPDTRQGLLISRGSNRLQIVTLGGDHYCSSYALKVEEKNIIFGREILARLRKRYC